MRETAGHDPYPRASCAVRVRSNAEVAPGVFLLVAETESLSGGERVPPPACGQFFMLRARPSGVLLGRPISVYRADGETLSFLILRKGRGTRELCGLRAGDELDLVGPVGNRFVAPQDLPARGELSRAGDCSVEHAASAAQVPGGDSASRVALVGGGIGVAPVAGFSFSLNPKSFDFFAAFRTGSYGLDGIAERASRLAIATEDGSVGVKGMLPAIFNAADYDLVYACGPTPMLKYVQQACAATGTRAYLSLEERMACGAGACLGCTVRTTNGNRRCCVDGPVFDSSEVLW